MKARRRHSLRVGDLVKVVVSDKSGIYSYGEVIDASQRRAVLTYYNLSRLTLSQLDRIVDFRSVEWSGIPKLHYV